MRLYMLDRRDTGPAPEVSPETPQAACHSWYGAYGEPLYSYLRFHLSSPDQAEDLTAEVFLRALRRFDQYDPSIGSPRAWLFRIAHNVLQDHMRQARRHPALPIAVFHDLKCEAPSPEERLLWEEEVAGLLAAVAQLSPRDREIIGLCYGADLPISAAAEILGVGDGCGPYPAVARAGAAAQGADRVTEHSGSEAPRPAPDISDLDRRLSRIRFEPRASFEPELEGRMRRGEEPALSPHRPSLRRLWPVPVLTGLAAVLAFLLLAPRHRVTVDRCCYDLDGGGKADDGVLIVAQRNGRVYRLSIYEDVDGSGSHTPADIIRLDRIGDPLLEEVSPSGLTTIRHCCQDLDGGGPADDGIIVVGTPPDRVVTAAIYELR